MMADLIVIGDEGIDSNAIATCRLAGTMEVKTFPQK
jgi:hypothetical protein